MKELGAGCLVMILMSIAGFSILGLVFVGDVAYLIPLLIIGGIYGIVVICEQASKNKAKQAEQKRIEEEQRAIDEKNQRTANVRKQITDNSGYELDILPFLELLLNIREADAEYRKIYENRQGRVQELKKLSTALNEEARVLGITQRLEIHVR